MNTILVSTTVWNVMNPISRALAAKLMFAAIVSLAVASGLTSCVMAPPQGGYAQQQRRQPAPQQYAVGQYVSASCFGNQPKSPTPGSVRILWSEVFGPRGPMVNDMGGNRAMVQNVPVGLVIMYDRQTQQAWKENCGNRLMLAEVQAPQQEEVVQEAPQRRSGGWQINGSLINIGFTPPYRDPRGLQPWGGNCYQQQYPQHSWGGNYYQQQRRQVIVVQPYPQQYGGCPPYGYRQQRHGW